MALKVGDLYVLLSAKTSAFGKGMESAAQLTEQVAKRVKRAATEIGRAGAMIGAGIAAALAVAAQHNAAVANEVGRSKEVFNTFASEIATAMLPALRSMTEHLRELLGWWQSLSPETKQQIAHWVEVATVVGLAALALGKVAGIVAAIMPLFEGLGAVLALGLAPIVGIVVALAAVAVAVAYLHKAWRENWGGIQEKTRGVIEALSGYWESFKDWLSHGFFDWFIDKWAEIEKAIAHAANFMAHPLNGAERDQQNRVSDQTIDAWAAKAKAGAMGDALELAKTKVEEFANDTLDELKIAIGEVADWVKKTVGWTGQQGTITTHAAEQHVTAAQRLGEVGEQGRMADYYENTSVESLSRSKKLGEDDEQGHTTAATAQAYEREVQIREYWNDQLDKLGNGLKAGAMKVVSKLGDLGEVINSGVQGFQSGGIWGAIIAVFVELLSKFQRFQELVDIGNGQIASVIQTLSAAFNPIIDALRGFMGASGILTDVVLRLLTPIFKQLGKAVDALIPTIITVAGVLEALQPIFDLIGIVLGPIFEAIGYVLRFVGLTILGTMNGLAMLWEGILHLLWEIFASLHLDDAAKEISKAWFDAKANVDKIQNQMKSLWSDGGKGVSNKAADTAESLGKLGDAADKAAEQLTNMPSGFKIALDQFNATLATSSSSGGGGGGASYDAWSREFTRQNFRNTGNPAAGSARTKRNGEI